MQRTYSQAQVKELIAQAMTPLLERIAEQDRRIVALQAELAQLKKNSSNSSKPPSSDIVKPPKDSDGKGPPAGGGKIGGQPGHVKHERANLPPEEVDAFKEYRLKHCPDCGGKVTESADPPRILQQIELAERPLILTEHQAMAAWCAHCQKTHVAELPQELVRAGLLGPRLTALCGWFKSRGHDSYSTMEEFIRDVGGLAVSRGLLAKALQKVSGALEKPYAQLADTLASEPVLHVDETGHCENQQRMWTWVFRAQRFTLFHIDPSRGSQVLTQLLGQQFKGVLGCDYFSAYRKYMGDPKNANFTRVQFCLAHLIRDVKFLSTLPDAATRNWATKVLDALRRLFGVIHRQGQLTPVGFKRSLAQARDMLIQRLKRAPVRHEPQAIVQRFKEHGKAYFEFITTPGIEPTNNLAEQALRCVVIDRRLTQGTRSLAGREFCQRIWTAAATCRQQGRSLFEYLHSAVESFFAKRPIPPLLIAGA